MLSILSDLFLEFNEWWQALLATVLLFIIGSVMAFLAYKFLLVWGGPLLIFPGIIFSIGAIFCAFAVLYGLWITIISI